MSPTSARAVAIGEPGRRIVGPDDLILVTGATGFIGTRLVECLVGRGFRNLRCFVRPSSDAAALDRLSGARRHGARIEMFGGNLLSPDDCAAATRGAAVIFHLATSRDGRSFPEAFLNSVVTTRNLLDASLRHRDLRRFVNISSLAVYTNSNKRRRRLLDESSPVERRPELRGDAYLFSKVKQDEIVAEYGRRCGIRYVTVRPGYVYGPGKRDISGRVGIGTFGLFLHMGGPGRIPLTYVDNCAEAIALAGLQHSVDGEVFNVVDDDLPSSRQFLRQYKQHVRRFRSVYVPHCVSYALCYLWERYSIWSEGQLAPVFNRQHWHAYWKTTQYSNERLKHRTGWTPRVATAEGLRRYFEACRDRTAHA
jgi:nucleoside-diphosphate-sugar epimerase